MAPDSRKRGRQPPAASQLPRNPNRKGRAGSRFPRPRHTSAASPLVTTQDTASSSRSLGASPSISSQATRTHDTGSLGTLLVTPHGYIDLSTSDDPIGDCTVAVEAGGVYMALEVKPNGTAGCAYFVAASSTIYLYEDMRVADLELIESLLFQAQPTSIIVPSRSPEKLMETLDRLSRWPNDDPNDAEGEHGFVLRSVVSSEFNPDYGRQALARPDGTAIGHGRSAFYTTAVEDVADHVGCGDANPQKCMGASEQNDMMLLGTLVNLHGQISLGCAGALIRDVERKAAAASSTEQEHLTIRKIQTVTYDDRMFIAADALMSLQIFCPDLRQGAGTDTTANRPGSASRASQDRRSIFGLFRSLTLTSQGRRRLREIFTWPSTDLNTINERHQTISDLLDSESTSFVGTLQSALKGIKNVQPILAQLRRGLCLPSHLSSVKQSSWANLRDFCCSILQLVDTGHKLRPKNGGIVKKALLEIDPDAIFLVENKLATTIDFPASRECGRGVIASGVNPELDALKSTYGHLQKRLESICQGYRSRFSDNARDDIVGCVFHPLRGYLLVAAAVPGQEGRNHGMGNHSSNDDFSLDAREDVLLEDGLVYFKTPGLLAVDSEFGDLAGQIIYLEVKLFYNLGLEVLEKEDALFEASRAVGEIDSILALANGAKTFRLSRPRMTTENILHIHKGRHLLQELGLTTFVPNDCLLAGGTGRDAGDTYDDSADTPSTATSMPSTVVLTGPNHSGKSVYLKQVATILFLSHVGSFVPAGAAIIGITDKILTRIATRESVSRDESAFGVDLRQAAFSINLATRRSLVLVDEFGKGTAVADGAALFDAFLHYFLHLSPCDSPKVLAATHFHEVFERRGFRRHPRLGLFHMSITVNSTASRPEDRVEFLHELRGGRSTESFGCHCAAISGVPAPIVERASQISVLLSRGANLGRVCLQTRGGGSGELQENEDRARLFLAAMAEALDACTALQSPRELLQHVFSCEGL